MAPYIPHICVLKFEFDYGYFNTDDRSLSEVFKLFDLIHIVTTDHSSITRITKEVCYCIISVFFAFAFMQATCTSRLLKILHLRMLYIWS